VQSRIILGFPVKVRSAKPAPAGITGFHGCGGLAAMLPHTEVLVNLLPLFEKVANVLIRLH
jgi:hypothetical protein